MPQESIFMIFLKAAVIFVCGIVLASLFVWSLIQGIMVHISGDITSPMVYYFTAWLMGVAAFTLYFQAKILYHYAKISK